jgi:hypothetical protein
MYVERSSLAPAHYTTTLLNQVGIDDSLVAHKLLAKEEIFEMVRHELRLHK